MLEIAMLMIQAYSYGQSEPWRKLFFSPLFFGKEKWV